MLIPIGDNCRWSKNDYLLGICEAFHTHNKIARERGFGFYVDETIIKSERGSDIAWGAFYCFLDENGVKRQVSIKACPFCGTSFKSSHEDANLIAITRIKKYLEFLEQEASKDGLSDVNIHGFFTAKEKDHE